MKFNKVPEKFIDKFPNTNIALLALDGSRGLGMETEDSDYDYKGVYVPNTDELLGLGCPREQFEHSDEELDFVIYEIGKFFSLALKGNPSVLQTMFHEKYAVKNDIGDMIIANKDLFLGETAIRNAYGGYAMSQILYLKRNHKFTKGRSVDSKIKKHIRHCFRLFDQGQSLLETGTLKVKLDDPEKYFKIAEMGEDAVYKYFEERDKEFRACKSVLPKEPNKHLADILLKNIRRRFL